jgi:hypothetical protein
VSQPQLEELRAHIEISDALARYCRSMDRMDDELAAGVWHPDGTVNYEPGIFAGPARAFVRWVRGVHEGVDVTTHRIANTVIRVRGAQASSEAYGHVMLVRRAEGDTATIRHTFGRYLDRWSLRDGRWAIDHRDYYRDLGYEQTVTALPGQASRDRSDPSYAVLGDVATLWPRPGARSESSVPSSIRPNPATSA